MASEAVTAIWAGIDRAHDNIVLTTQPMEEPENPRHLLDLFEMMEDGPKLLLATDYPHWDVDAPDRAFPIQIPEDARNQIYETNARGFYRLETRPPLVAGGQREWGLDPQRRLAHGLLVDGLIGPQAGRWRYEALSMYPSEHSQIEEAVQGYARIPHFPYRVGGTVHGRVPARVGPVDWRYRP